MLQRVTPLPAALSRRSQEVKRQATSPSAQYAGDISRAYSIEIKGSDSTVGLPETCFGPTGAPRSCSTLVREVRLVWSPDPTSV